MIPMIPIKCLNSQINWFKKRKFKLKNIKIITNNIEKFVKNLKNNKFFEIEKSENFKANHRPYNLPDILSY